MKKYSFIFSALLSAVILCGCGGNEEDFAKLMLKAKDSMAKGQVKEALTYSQKAQECQPNSPEAIVMTALAYERNQKNPEALKEIQKAVKIAPKNYFVQYTYGRLLYKNKKTDLSIVALKEAVKLDPKKTEARELLARAATEAKDYETAMQQYHALINDPSYKNKDVVYNEIGVYYYLVKKNYKQSSAYLNKALNANNKVQNPTILLNAAVLCEMRKFYGAAQAFYRKYLSATERDTSRAKKRAAVNTRLSGLSSKQPARSRNRASGRTTGRR